MCGYCCGGVPVEKRGQAHAGCSEECYNAPTTKRKRIGGGDSELQRQITPAARRPVLLEVDTERDGQDEKWGEQNHPDGTGYAYLQEKADQARRDCNLAAATGTVTWRHILREEYYEALACTDDQQLRAELVQVAAVAVSWIEAIDRRHLLPAGDD